MKTVRAESMFPDPALSKAQETVFLAAIIPMLLSVNHHREAFCQVAFPGISESTKHAKLRVLPVDSLKFPIVKFHQFLGRPQRFYDIARNVSVSPMTIHCKTPSPPIWNATE